MKPDLCDWCDKPAMDKVPFGPGTGKEYAYRACDDHLELAQKMAVGFVSAAEGSLADHMEKEAK